MSGGERSLACEQCLRRSLLVAALAGRIENLRRSRGSVRDVLALDNQTLVRAVGGESSDLDLKQAALDARRDAQACGLTVICRHNGPYPERLLADRAVPTALFIAGESERWSELTGAGRDPVPAVAIVGARRASPEGLEIAQLLGRGLSAAGLTVISGMALGIDGAAHDGALAAGARTIAVLAGGAEVAYPRRRQATHRELIERAAVLSEAPPGFKAHRWSFLARNRLIAALADMTIVVEAAERSGSLVTAEMAIDLGRDVGAVPGSILNWRATGSNGLLREGAALVCGTDDVLDAVLGSMRLELPQVPVAAASIAPAAAALLDDIAGGYDTAVSLAARHGGAASVQALVAELELGGIVVRGPGGRIGIAASQAAALGSRA